MLGGFKESTNNTDDCEDNNPDIENFFDGEQMTFAPANEPSTESGPFQSQNEFIFSYLSEKKNRHHCLRRVTTLAGMRLI